jgi:hypothetical protein
MVAGGYPAWARNDGVAIPSAIVGVVADSVRSVTFVQNGAPRSLEIVNNAFYEEIAAPDPGAKWNELHVEYDSGAKAMARVPLP